MHTAKKSTPLLTRRQFLRVGLAGGAVLLTARLVYGPFARMRLAEVPEAEQLKTLNPRTATALAAIAPVMLGSAFPPAEPEETRLGAQHALVRAIDAAIADVKAGKTGNVPRELQNVHADTTGFDNRQHYLYPHDFPHRWVEQQYLPDALKDAHYYQWGDNKTEQAAKAYWERIKGKPL